MQVNGDELRARVLDCYRSSRIRFEELLAPLSDPALLARPLENRASAAWYWWHRARTEDAAFARLVGSAQVIEEDAWLERLNLTREQTERVLTIHTPRADTLAPDAPDSEVCEFAGRINLDGLRASWTAVGARTQAILETLPAEDLDERVGGEYVRLKHPDGRVEAAFVTHYRSGRTSRLGLKTPARDALRAANPALENNLYGVVAALRRTPR
jgi:hypothetical protein